ncbi:MAG: hypothetical protein LBK53_04660 [Heliobacteriaceae bacterium]|jgi:hypothetical protein|nr:hypothetical protein [Heliobacteriaceae bacterium]
MDIGYIQAVNVSFAADNIEIQQILRKISAVRYDIEKNRISKYKGEQIIRNLKDKLIILRNNSKKNIAEKAVKTSGNNLQNPAKDKNLKLNDKMNNQAGINNRVLHGL